MTQVFALICEFFSKSKFPPIEESVIDVGSVLSFLKVCRDLEIALVLLHVSRAKRKRHTCSVFC